MRSAMGVPVVLPSYTPERISTRSSSRRCVTWRDVPGLRRSRSGWMSASESAIPGGQPSITQPIAGPCDSPKVVTVKSVPRVLPDMVFAVYCIRRFVNGSRGYTSRVTDCDLREGHVVSRPNEKLGGGAFLKEPRVTNPLPANPASNRIHNVRGKRVILDADLAELYGVATKRLNQQVTRNKERFPADFAFPLSASEWENLRSQFATSSWGGRRSPPLAFTEHGALMAAGVLNSRRAIEVSI